MVSYTCKRNYILGTYATRAPTSFTPNQSILVQLVLYLLLCLSHALGITKQLLIVNVYSIIMTSLEKIEGKLRFKLLISYSELSEFAQKSYLITNNNLQT